MLIYYNQYIKNIFHQYIAEACSHGGYRISKERSKHENSLEGWSQNCNRTSALSKQDPGQVKFRGGTGKQFPPLDGKKLQSHIAKGHGYKEGNNWAIFVSNLPQRHFLTLKYLKQTRVSTTFVQEIPEETPESSSIIAIN